MCVYTSVYRSLSQRSNENTFDSIRWAHLGRLLGFLWALLGVPEVFQKVCQGLLKRPQAAQRIP